MRTVSATGAWATFCRAATSPGSGLIVESATGFSLRRLLVFCPSPHSTGAASASSQSVSALGRGERFEVWDSSACHELSSQISLAYRILHSLVTRDCKPNSHQFLFTSLSSSSPQPATMPPTSASSSLTITNPLHLYRAHLATSRLLPDPHQHRAALILQSVYERLLDYTPPAHLNTRLHSLARALDPTPTPPPRRLFPKLLSQNRDSKNLIRVLTTADHALELDTPQGLLLSGEVGTGKSMLLDLLYHSLPTASKKRWHFHAFMLHIISSLEAMRRTRALPGEENEYSLLRLARATVIESPVLFLDEFQMPDRAAAKLVSGLLVGFWGMGGVLVGSSNCRAEDLVQGAGAGREREFDGFLKALGRRCQFWDMGGSKDWRREARGRNWWRVGFAGEGANAAGETTAEPEPEPETPGKQPAYYFTTTSPAASWDAAIRSALKATSPTSPTPPTFTPSSLTIYTRTLPIPHSHAGIALFTFSELCAAPLGPADYITLTSHYHTLFITDIPPLTHATLKNEARRFITLLDAVYESGVRLAIRTSAESIDDLFFPDTVPAHAAATAEWDMSGDSDPLSAEVYAEAHQDLTAPFRPNIVAYDDTGRSEAAAAAAPDFADVAAWTGEDERFAWRRAVSRLWEVTGEGWWGGVEWRPPALRRGWEGGAEQVVVDGGGEKGEVEKGEMVGTHEREGVIFSPFRKHPQEPPRFGGEHFWSVVRWGRRAGNWGKGVEGVKERKEGGGEGR